jgi:spermidine/putrescine transport system permease protein
MSESLLTTENSASREASRRGFARRWIRNPWRRPTILATITWGYIAWSLIPLAIAIAVSFNNSRSSSSVHLFSLQWWWTDPTDSLLHDPELHTAVIQSLKLSLTTMVIAVPLGVAFALGIDRWHGRPATGANLVMLLSFVMPEIILGLSLFFVFSFVLKFIPLGSTAQILGLVTFQLSYPVIIVRARLLTIGKEYEEAAMDLGATPKQSIRAVLLPLLYPAIFASAAIVFADTIDDFVTVRYLSGPASSEPLSVKIYNFARGQPSPAVNAAATFMLVSTIVVGALAYLLYRAFTKGQRSGGGVSDFATQL